jgi:hypothetical protein
MRDGQEHVGNAQKPSPLARRSAEVEFWNPFRTISDLQIGPARAFLPAAAQALQHSLLCGPSPGEMLRRVAARLSIADLAWSVDPIQEHFPMPFDHSSNTQAFHDIGTDAKDFHGISWSQTFGLP